MLGKEMSSRVAQHTVLSKRLFLEIVVAQGSLRRRSSIKSKRGPGWLVGWLVGCSRPGRPPKRASVGLSLAASHLAAAAGHHPQHSLKKHRMDNGDYYENGHLEEREEKEEEKEEEEEEEEEATMMEASLLCMPLQSAQTESGPYNYGLSPHQLREGQGVACGVLCCVGMVYGVWCMVWYGFLRFLRVGEEKKIRS
ncbi:hypothetical protein M0802_011113 [Mischocyttarus mexicanus]|nr:hypothetical protein M0802_011113 [Mischocyttarus mexicanus]